MIYDIFSFWIILSGLGSFLFLSSRAWANRKHHAISLNLFVLALCGLYLAGVYSIMGFDTQVEKLTLGVYIRPVLLLYLLIPSLNVYRVKL
jgi:hypothetical protein